MSQGSKDRSTIMSTTTQQHEEVEQLRSNNFRLNSTVQEMQLEISYYKGELKRLEWEKNVLKQDVSKMSDLFRGWLTELQSSNTRSVIDDTDYISNLVRRPALPMERILQLEQGTMLLTTCQAPFFVEYANKAWTTACGWECDEVLGLTCAFLQGECTDLKVTAAFTKDLKEVGYATMKITNYRKNGTLFSATVHVFPVYDTVSPTGADGDDPVLTHFATVLEDIATVSMDEAPRLVPESVAQCLTPAGGLDRLPALNGSIDLDQFGVDRRLQSRRCEVEYQLTADRFELIGATVRLSDLLRLMLGSVEAMVLTDSQGRILHVNHPWRKLCGYSLSDVEGRSCAILQGPMTDILTVRRCEHVYRKEGRAASMTVANYRKDGSMFNNSVTVVPIRGGYLHGEVTHYCALLKATVVDRAVPTSASVRPDGPFLDLAVDPSLVVGELASAVDLSHLTGVVKRHRERDADTWSEDVEPDVALSVWGVGAGEGARDVNYFECEEDDEEEEDLTLRHMPFAMTTGSTGKDKDLSAPFLRRQASAGEACGAGVEMAVEGAADDQTVDTRCGGGGSVFSGHTDGACTYVSGHSSSSAKSSGSTVALYKEAESPVWRSSSSLIEGLTSSSGKHTDMGKKADLCGSGSGSGSRKHLTITLPSRLNAASKSCSSSDSTSSSSSGASGPASSGSDDSFSTLGMRKPTACAGRSDSSVETGPTTDHPARPVQRPMLARKRSAGKGSFCGGEGSVARALAERVAQAHLSDLNAPSST